MMVRGPFQPSPFFDSAVLFPAPTDPCLCCYCSLALAGNKGPWGRSTAPLSMGVGRIIERKKAKLVGQDNNSLTEQQRKRTVITTTLIRKICKTGSGMYRATLTARCPARSRAVINFPLANSLTQNQARQDTVLNIPFVWPVWVSWPSCFPS